MKQRLQETYQKEIAPKLKEEFKVTNYYALPKIEKIVLNIGLGEALTNSSAIEKAVNDLTIIAGQRPVVTRSKKAISNFKIKIGDKIGAKVTLRKYKMWSMLDRMINLTLPRVKDFRGVSRRAFDERGNMTIGFKEQTVFPEIDSTKIDKLRGLEVTIVVKNSDKKKSIRLFELFGMPFEKVS
ncbi:MAG: 50S ribosomal protein L5 [bacterium]